MSTRYVASGKAQASTANTNLISIRSTATRRAEILEFHLFAEAATAFANASLWLTTVVDTAGTAVVGQPENSSAPAALCTVQTAPSGGTNASVAIRRAVTAASIGSGIMWLWPPDSPLVVPVSLSAMFRNDGAVGPAFTWVLVWQE